MNTPSVHFRQFAHYHDDIPAFHAVYLVLTLAAAAFFNLGTFALLIAIHMVLDVVKYREHLGYSWELTFEGTVRESLVDVTLLLVGLVFAVYLHHSVAFVGLSGALRAELTLIRLFGTLLPKMKIVHNFLKVIAHIRHYLDHAHPHLRTGWSSIDKFCFGSIAVCVMLLFMSPMMLNVDPEQISSIFREEIVPSIMK